MKDFKCTNSFTKFENPRFSIEERTFESKDTTITHSVVHSKPSVAVIIKNNDGEIAFIKQFRTTIKDWVIELPAGIIEDGETIEQAAKREAEEETGLIICNVYNLIRSPIYLSPSVSDQVFNVALAIPKIHSVQKLDELEQIEANILWIPEEEVEKRLKNFLYSGQKFMDNLILTGYSVYTLLTYLYSNP